MVKERRLLDENDPNGYLESDRDFVLNNLDEAVKLLEQKLLQEKIEAYDNRQKRLDEWHHGRGRSLDAADMERKRRDER